MAITAAICNSYKQEALQGVHGSGDTYKIALYTDAATLSKSTTAYTASGEVANGNGYTTGGKDLAGFSVTLDGDTAILDWTTDPVWAAPSSFTARGALIYNASQSNKAVCVLDFGENVTCTNGTFTVTFPAPAASTGLLRWEPAA
jgi:hypothetical protein